MARTIPPKVQQKLQNLPESPGVYLMRDANDKVIYVGKAKVLRNRVRSYFNRSAQRDSKTRALVSFIRNITWWVTNSELEALVLENELIKRYKPRFNIRLKDDRQYPYIKVNWQDDFPKVEIVRDMIKDGARYFGPYSSSSACQRTLEALRRVFPYLDCERTIDGQDESPCLYYHIKLCGGPCIGAQNREEYRNSVKGLMNFLEGDSERVIAQLEEQMERAAENLNFELAARYRDRIKAARHIAEQQKVISATTEDADYISVAQDERKSTAAVQVYFVRRGRLIGRENFILEGAEYFQALDEAELVESEPPSEATGGVNADENADENTDENTDENALVPLLNGEAGSNEVVNPDVAGEGIVGEGIAGEGIAGEDIADETENIEGALIGAFIQQFYDGAALVPSLVLVDALPPNDAVLEAWLASKRGSKVEIRQPQRGSKRELMEMAHNNAAEYLRVQQAEQAADSHRQTEALAELQEALGLARPPARIECYDISTLQGTNTTASMVVFAKGAPLKRAYKRFKIRGRGAQGEPDDYAAMREALRRRFRRAVEETVDNPGKKGRATNDWKLLPDLLIIDGGKGQLSSALEVLDEFDLRARVPVVGLAKREEEIFVPGRERPVWLKRGSPALHLVQRIRDEAHRFAINYHRTLRRKESTRSKLDDVPGIGPARRKALLTHFNGDVNRIRRASLEELSAVPGMSRKIAEAVKEKL